MELKSDFDRELDDYISSRKSSGFTGRFTQTDRIVEKNEELEDSVPISEVYNDELPTNNGHELENEEKKPRGIRKWFGFLSSNETDEEVPKVDNSAIEDMKEIAKISLSIIKLLPLEKIITFKNSDEFSKLKTILSKHKLIK